MATISFLPVLSLLVSPQSGFFCPLAAAAKEGRGAETITEIKTYFALRRVRTNMFIGRLVLRSISALVLILNFEVTTQL